MPCHPKQIPPSNLCCPCDCYSVCSGCSGCRTKKSTSLEDRTILHTVDFLKVQAREYCCSKVECLGKSCIGSSSNKFQPTSHPAQHYRCWRKCRIGGCAGILISFTVTALPKTPSNEYKDNFPPVRK